MELARSNGHFDWYRPRQLFPTVGIGTGSRKETPARCGTRGGVGGMKRNHARATDARARTAPRSRFRRAPPHEDRIARERTRTLYPLLPLDRRSGAVVVASPDTSPSLSVGSRKPRHRPRRARGPRPSAPPRLTRSRPPRVETTQGDRSRAPQGDGRPLQVRPRSHLRRRSIRPLFEGAREDGSGRPARDADVPRPGRHEDRRGARRVDP